MEFKAGVSWDYYLNRYKFIADHKIVFLTANLDESIEKFRLIQTCQLSCGNWLIIYDNFRVEKSLFAVKSSTMFIMKNDVVNLWKLIIADSLLWSTNLFGLIK